MTRFFKHNPFYLLFLFLMLAGCDRGDAVAEPVANAGATGQPERRLPERVVEIESSKDLLRLFAQHNYTPQAWQAGIRDVPRIYITDIPQRWRDKSASMPVLNKKRLFFRVMAPLTLKANEKILAQRQRLLTLDLNAAQSADWLQQMAQQYRIKVDSLDTERALTDLHARLVRRVDIVPVSLVLAQAAEESGWGTSRFTIEGNALFGQWDFSGNGMKPKQQRKELGNYGIARFDTPQASVDAYMRNLNSHAGYKRLRAKRAELRASEKPITGLALVDTLDKYSERGMDYVESLKSMINYNKLADTDFAVLTGEEIIYVQP